VKFATTTVLTLAALLGACSSNPIAPGSAGSPSATKPSTIAAAPSVTATNAGATRADASPSASPAPAATPATAVAQAGVPAYLDPKSDLSTGRSVYFDFDQAVIKPEFGATMEKHGRYLMTNPKVSVRIEGNTDERGSPEYNLALGQKRAEAVRQALKLLGVRDTQMEAVSWGEEKPRAKGHDESDWSQNRRADLQYPAK
jgi:peptidoglycan-associated lipoprotein